MGPGELVEELTLAAARRRQAVRVGRPAARDAGRRAARALRLHDRRRRRGAARSRCGRATSSGCGRSSRSSPRWRRRSGWERLDGGEQALARGVDERGEDQRAVGRSRAAGRPRARDAASGPSRCPRSFTTPATSAIEPFGFSVVAEDDLAVRLELGEQLVVGEAAALAVLDGDVEPLPGLAAGEVNGGVGPLDAQPRRRGRRTRATRSGAARRAGGRPRRGSGSRCRSRARARPRRRSRRRRPSPARSGRSRRSGGSRRTRSRPAARPRPTSGSSVLARARRAPARRRARRAPRRRRGRRSTRGRRRRRSSDGLASAHFARARSRSSRSAGWRAAARTSARPRRGPAPGRRRPTSRSTTRPTRASPTAKPSWRSELSTASPCGSRMPGFGRTSTVALIASTTCGVGEVVVERDAGQPLERLDVARAGAGDDVVGQLRARGRSCPSRAPRSSRARTACRRTAAGRPARTRRRARSARSRA